MQEMEDGKQSPSEQRHPPWAKADNRIMTGTAGKHQHGGHTSVFLSNCYKDDSVPHL